MTPATAHFDISALDSVVEPTTPVGVIFDADGTAKSGFNIVGKDSKAYTAISFRLRAESLQRSAKRRMSVDAKTQEGAELLASNMDANDAAMANAVLVGWFGFGKDGAIAEFDRVVAEKMLAKYPTWRAKVLEALENDANFTKG